MYPSLRSLTWLASAVALGCTTSRSAGEKIDPTRGTLFLHAVDDDAPDLRANCPGVEVFSEKLPGREHPVRYAFASDPTRTGRTQLETCLAQQTTPAGEGFAVGPVDSPRGWRSYLIRVAPVLSPEHGESVGVTPGEGGQPPTVGVELTPEGQRRLAEFSRLHVKRRVAIVVDDLVQSAPIILEPITTTHFQLSIGEGRAPQHAEALANSIAGQRPGEALRGVRTFGRAVP